MRRVALVACRRLTTALWVQMVLTLEAALRQSEETREALEASTAAAAGRSDPESADSLAAIHQQISLLQVSSFLPADSQRT